VGNTSPNNAIKAAHMQLANGIESNNLTAQQFQNMPGANQQARISGYQANLIQQQQGQMASVKPMQNAGGPQNQGSPMMTQGGAPDSGAIANYYNPGQIGPNGLRSEPGGPAGSGGNHALQDYQMQLMLLEQQNKKRLMMARQEQDNMMPRSGDGSGGPGGGPGPVGPNGQPFQQGTSPQGPRSVNSPNPVEQIKRGTPHMNPAGMPSPLPEGSQNRGSPSGSMNFNMQGGQMDPNMNPQYFKMTNGMDPNMVANMRPPSSHPGGGFNPQMTSQQQQMVIARQQQAQQAQQQHQQAAAVQNWQQAGPNGQMMQQQAQGGPPQQAMGTPQQRAMPPPPAVAAGPAANGRTQPPSPQQNPAQPPTPSQANKANPKKKNETKDSKAKVYSIAFKWIFSRNVDIDDSGLLRRDPPQTSTLHRPPMPIMQAQRPHPQHLLPPSIRKASTTARTAPYNLSRTASLQRQQRTRVRSHNNPILCKVVDLAWVIQ